MYALQKGENTVRKEVNFFFYFSCSNPASTAQTPRVVSTTLTKTILQRSITIARGIMTRALSTDTQICSPVATHSLPGPFLLPAANAAPQSPLQRATRTLHQTRQSFTRWQPGESCHRGSNSPGCTSHKAKGWWYLLFLVSNQGPEGQLISRQWYIYVQAQHTLHRGKVWSLQKCQTCTRLANLDVRGWRRPWQSAFPVNRVPSVVKSAENIRKHCDRSSLLRLLERKLSCHFHHQRHFKNISYPKRSQIISNLYALQSLQTPLNGSLGTGRKPQRAKHSSGGGKAMARKSVVNLSFMLFGNQSPKYPV